MDLTSHLSGLARHHWFWSLLFEKEKVKMPESRLIEIRSRIIGHRID